MKREVIYKIFSNLPVIHTERLTLRKIRVSDTDDMFEYACQPEVTRYLTWYPHRNREYTKEYLEYLGSRYATGDFYDWAITLDSEGGKMIGTCGFTRFDPPNNSAEIGYVLNPAYRHMGIATEAAAAIIGFGFNELQLHRIEARYMKGNDASRRVMERLGMSFEGEMRESLYHNGEYKTVGICSIINK